VPARHTIPLPHEVPSATFDPESTQLAAPVVGSQVVEPTWHGFVGWQAAPALHAQVPAVQVWPLPQEVPSGTAWLVAVQLAAPVVGSQVVAPTWQGSPVGVQATAALQVHAPTVHVVPFPQDVPSGTAVVVATQTFVPVSHVEEPTWHGSAGGLQVMPALQRLHAPLSQTSFGPQGVPFATDAPVSLQAGPAEQVCDPTWQRFGGVHDAPTVQALHTPALQTSFGPQVVPSGTFPLSVQTGDPVVQT